MTIPLVQPWMFYPLTVTSKPGMRSREKYLEVVAALDPVNNPRYIARDLNADGTQETFCNIFVWDCTRAMSAEIPHWVDQNGAPAKVGPPNKELDANAVAKWLETRGKLYGWREVIETSARGAAQSGCPVVAAWWNHSGIGHVAMIVPSPTPGVTYIAQAGAKNYLSAPLAKGFGRIVPKFFAAL